MASRKKKKKKKNNLVVSGVIQAHMPKFQAYKGTFFQIGPRIGLVMFELKVAFVGKGTKVLRSDMTSRALRTMITKCEKLLEGSPGGEFKVAGLRGKDQLVILSFENLGKIVKAGKECLAALNNGGWNTQIKKLKLKV